MTSKQQQQNVCVPLWERAMLGNAIKKTKAGYKIIQCWSPYLRNMGNSTRMKWGTHLNKDLEEKHGRSNDLSSKYKGPKAAKSWCIWQRARKLLWLE